MKTRLLLLLLAALSFNGRAQVYVPALPGYHYEFPRDHFNHPEYQTEWWYYTGKQRSANARTICVASERTSLSISC